MSTPGFTAELSLSPVTKSFGGRWRNPVAANTVEAALRCNQACLDTCTIDLSECDDIPQPRRREQCIRDAKRNNILCAHICCR
jgi:hypothetical protein